MFAERPPPPVRAAILGLGWWGQAMVDAVRKDGNGTLVFTHAVVRNTAKATEFAKAAGLTLSSDYAGLLCDPDIDAVVLATPHSAHVDQIVAAADRGKPVFTEKPIALELGDARRAVIACRNAQVVLGIGTDRRFLPAMLRLASIVRDGELGDILHIEGQYSNDNMSRGVSGTWRSSAEEAPGAGMTGPGLHVLDSMISLAGPVATLSGQLYRPFGDTLPVDAVSLMIKFASGATGIMGCVRGVQNYFRLAVFGSAGRAEMRGFGQLHICRNGEAEVVENYSPELAICETLERFANAVLGKAEFPVSPKAILDTVAAFEAAIMALELGGRPIVVETIGDA